MVEVEMDGGGCACELLVLACGDDDPPGALAFRWTTPSDMTSSSSSSSCPCRAFSPSPLAGVVSELWRAVLPELPLALDECAIDPGAGDSSGKGSRSSWLDRSIAELASGPGG